MAQRTHHPMPVPLTQANSEPPNCTHHHLPLSNTATDHLQTSNLVDKVTAPLPVLPELGKAIPDILHAILDPLVGEDIPKAQGKTLDLVKNLVPPVKTTWAEIDEGDDAASEKDSPMRPSPTDRRSRLGIQTRLSPALILLPVF
jgi:hypothetical protein